MSTRSERHRKDRPQEMLFTVSANFTAEPVREYLQFWLAWLGMGPARVEFSGYNQVFQDLMAPENTWASRTPGANFLLIRLEDWARNQSSGQRAETLSNAVHEFIASLSAFAQRSGRPTILMLCPASPGALDDNGLAGEVCRVVGKLSGLTLITGEDLSALYPVNQIEDAEADRQGHIPFTQTYWAAMGTMLARKARTLLTPAHKVIVVDGDNTLWGGVVGEAGAGHVKLDGEYREFQQMLKQRKSRGMLLALASKNEESDVADVFAREDMLLRREDFVSWKVNWDRKSHNISSLAKELELGPDSFLFIDDNPTECAEVEANCPGVTALQFPSDYKQIPAFLRHVWPFDLSGATAVDEKRTEMYRQQSERNQFRTSASSFGEFIARLQLEVTMSPLGPANYERAAQLSKRTNQFNTSGVRWTNAEITQLIESGGRQALMVQARDRFGDYGEVGLAVYSTASATLTVDNLLMSCRVLGKGVEHQTLAAIGAEALRLGATNVVIPYRRTERNQPARNFLKSVGAQLQGEAFVLPASEAAACVFHPDSLGDQESIVDNSEVAASVNPLRPDFNLIANQLQSVESIRHAVSRHYRRERPALENEFVAAKTSIEAKLASIWEEVLHIHPIGVTDSFLRLGGQSLQAASIAARIASEFEVRISLGVVLSNSTIASLAEQIGSSKRTATDHLGKAREVVLSPAQQRLWFLDQFIPNRAAYNIPLGLRIEGALDLGILEAAFERVMLRHDTLRSTIDGGDGPAVLRISEKSSLSVRRVTAASEAEAIQLAKEEAERTFDLSNESPLRCLEIQLSSTDTLLVMNVHHIASDGWSTSVLLRDLGEAYNALKAGHEPSWTPLNATYNDYSAWQRRRMASGDFQSDLDYWKEELRGAPSLLEFPTDKPRPSVMTYLGANALGQIPPAVRKAIDALAEKAQCTPFVVLLAALQTFLFRYSQQEDIVVGTPVAGRTHPDVEDLIGCFVNTLALRAQLDGQISFTDHLKQVRAKVSDALSHQELPFEHLVNELGLERDLSRSPLFQVMLVLQNTPASSFAPEGTKVTSVPLHNGGAKFDLVLEITPVGEGYQLALEYNSSLFLPETAERMLRHFTRLLDQVCQTPERQLGALSLMDSDEVQQMLRFVNHDAASFDNADCLHTWFERTVAKTPNVAALSCEGRVLTYSEVNRRANQIAHYLIECGVGPDVLVGLCLDRSEQLVIALLGILKAGGAYLPIDLSYPTDRLAFMLSDTQAPVLLTERKLAASLPAHNARNVFLDDEVAELSKQPETNPIRSVNADHMAYVIYTSGSTGKPKGCMVTHRNVVRLMRATEHWYGFNDRDVWTLFHSSAFDFSVWELWGPLLYGGRLVVVPFLVSRSPEAFYELLASEKVTVLNQTPSAFRQLIQAEEAVGQKELQLRYVIFGGEALEMQSLRAWFDRHGDTQPQLVNMYGITETTVHVTYRPLSKSDLKSGSVIGVPIPDLEIYILDPQRQPVPIGVPGEMYVGGAGLARGYLNRAELTEARFIADHLTEKAGARLYRTGDSARFLPNHDIEYLGRIDQQVKIRGFRIELGEIESVLCSHTAVREATVLAREDAPGDKRLVAYLVASAPVPEVSILREHLKKKLPEYMVPAAFVYLDKLPLTNNGKIDRKALPVPEHRPHLASRYVAPRNANEEKLAAIWAKVLRMEQVGINDNFFELGGDSILSIQIISQARQQGLKLTPKQLFGNQTIAELAAVATSSQEESRPVATAVGPLYKLDQATLNRLVSDPQNIEDVYPLSPIQTLYYSTNPTAELMKFNHWHCTLHGALNIEAYQRAWQQTLQRHTILRATIHGDGLKDPVQIVHRKVTLPWTIEDWRDADPATHADRWEAFRNHDRTIPLKLTEAPPMRFALVRLADAQYKFLWSVPALLLDGWSWPLVFRDASQLYAAFCNNEASTIEKAPPYRDYLEWLSKQSVDEATEFWRASVQDFSAPTPLPTEAPGAASGERYAKIQFQIQNDATQALENTTRRLQLTLNTLVQGAWSLLLSRQSGKSDVVFGATFAGRPADLQGVESIVGPFVNNLPVRAHAGDDIKLGDFFRQIHTHLLKMSQYQFTPLMEIQKLSEVPWHQRLFDSLIVFQNYPIDKAGRNFGGRIEMDDFVKPVQTNYPAMLIAEPGESLRLTLIYDQQSIARSTAEQWKRDLQVLFEIAPLMLDKSVAEMKGLLSAPASTDKQAKPRLRTQSQNFVPPQTEMEHTIASIWQEMFGLEKIGIDESFFELGGHSLLLVQMHGRLRKALQTDFPIVTLFEHPTIRALARCFGQPVVTSQAAGAQWKDRAVRQKQALAQLRNALKK